MTKGKYAARATRRREDESVQSEVASYQHNIKRLTAANNELSAALAAERDGRKQEVRRLKAQLDEGLSPELIAVRGELEKQRERASSAVARTAEIERKQGDLVHFASKLLHNITGCTGLEATERIMASVGGLSVPIADARTGAVKPNSRSPEATKALQRVRGWRSGPKVIEHLDALIADARTAGE